MKILSYISLSIFSLVVGFWFGYTNVFGILDKVKNENKILGSYKTNDYNGIKATINFKNDYTCIFTGYGNKCSWEIIDDKIYVQLNDEINIEGYIIDEGIIFGLYFFEKIEGK